jgi:hypothetical protein
MAVGSRFLGHGDYPMPFVRRWAVRLLAAVIRSTGKARISDPTSGFRAIRRPLLDAFAADFPAHYLGDTFEAVLVSARRGYRLTEVPVEMRERQGGRPSADLYALVQSMLRACTILLTGTTFDLPPRAAPTDAGHDPSPLAIPGPRVRPAVGTAPHLDDRDPALRRSRRARPPLQGVRDRALPDHRRADRRRLVEHPPLRRTGGDGRAPEHPVLRLPRGRLRRMRRTRHGRRRRVHCGGVPTVLVRPRRRRRPPRRPGHQPAHLPGDGRRPVRHARHGGVRGRATLAIPAVRAAAAARPHADGAVPVGQREPERVRGRGVRAAVGAVPARRPSASPHRSRRAGRRRAARDGAVLAGHVDHVGARRHRGGGARARLDRGATVPEPPVPRACARPGRAGRVVDGRVDALGGCRDRGPADRDRAHDVGASAGPPSATDAPTCGSAPRSSGLLALRVRGPGSHAPTGPQRVRCRCARPRARILDDVVAAPTSTGYVDQGRATWSVPTSKRKVGERSRSSSTASTNWSPTGCATATSASSSVPPNAVRDCEFAYLCVPTPQGEDGSADLSYIETAARRDRPVLPYEAIVVNKSTVPVGSPGRRAGAEAPRRVRSSATPSSSARVRPSTTSCAPTAWSSAATTSRRRSRWPTSTTACGPRSSSPTRPRPRRSSTPPTRSSPPSSASSTRSPRCARASAPTSTTSSLGMGYDKRIGTEFLRPGPGWGGSAASRRTRGRCSRSPNDAGYDFDLLARRHRRQRRAVRPGGRQDPRRRRRFARGPYRRRVGPHLQGPHRRPARLAVGLDHRAAASPPGARCGVRPDRSSRRSRSARRRGRVRRRLRGLRRCRRSLAVLTEWDDFRWLDPTRSWRRHGRPHRGRRPQPARPRRLDRAGFTYQGIGR